MQTNYIIFNRKLKLGHTFSQVIHLFKTEIV